MVLIFVCIVALILLGILGGRYTRTHNWWIEELICPVAITAGFVGLLLYGVLAFKYIKAGYEAEIINREFGTNYSQEEVFWAKDVLNEVRHIERMRVELNGNLPLNPGDKETIVNGE